mmetsp:Transcript_4828/g.15181  ORF Transcript_4828/g.15181 Transcript_4828/m.15181 type:complete len:202 (-) Transcript_4828:138-743(-)
MSEKRATFMSSSAKAGPANAAKGTTSAGDGHASGRGHRPRRARRRARNAALTEDAATVAAAAPATPKRRQSRKSPATLTSAATSVPNIGVKPSLSARANCVAMDPTRSTGAPSARIRRYAAERGSIGPAAPSKQTARREVPSSSAPWIRPPSMANVSACDRILCSSGPARPPRRVSVAVLRNVSRYELQSKTAVAGPKAAS